MSEKLEEMLLAHQILSPDQIRKAQETQAQVGGKLSEVLVKLRLLPEERLASFLAEQLGLPLLQLKDLVVSPRASAVLDVEFMERNAVLPLRRQEATLLLAMADPLDLDAQEEVRFLTGLNVRPVVAARGTILKAVDYYCRGSICPELAEAESALRASGPSAATSSATRGAIQVAPAKVLQALVELLLAKKVLTREELMERIEKRK